MTPGDDITIKATVLRVDGNRVDTQTADGQLIQTDIANVTETKPEAAANIKGPIAVAGGKVEHDVKAASKK